MLVPLAELKYTCKTSFVLFCVLDHDLGDVNVSLLTIQLSCPYVASVLFSCLILEQFFCNPSLLGESKNDINTTPYDIEPSLLLILVKQSATCKTFCWNVSEVNNSKTECLKEFRPMLCALTKSIS